MIPIARGGTAGRAAEAAIETNLACFVGAGFGIGSQSAVVCRAVGFLSLFQLSRAKFKLTRRWRIAIGEAWRPDGAGWRFAPRPSRRVVSHNRQAKALNLRSRRCAPAPGCLGRVALGPRLLGRLRAPLRRRFAFARSGRARPALAAFATSDIFD